VYIPLLFTLYTPPLLLPAAYCEKGLFEEAEADGFECLNVAKTNGVDFVKAYYKV
jgi:hypothetical protein